MSPSKRSQASLESEDLGDDDGITTDDGTVHTSGSVRKPSRNRNEVS